MAYIQKAGRDNLTNPNISALTNGGSGPNPSTSLRTAVYEANKTFQDIKDNGLGNPKPAERLANPKLSSFRYRGTETYKDAVAPKGEDAKVGDISGSFYKSKNDSSYPYLSSRFNTNPQIKDPINRNTSQVMRQKVVFGDNQDDRTYADIDKTEGDKRARGSFQTHPKIMREAEKAAKTSFKISKNLANAQVTGSESTMLSAINNAVSTTQSDTYMGNVAHSPQIKKDGIWQKADPISYENASMVQRYIDKSKRGTKRQDNADTFRNVGQDLQKAKTNSKFSLNSNSNSNTPVNSNNLFRNERFATDITSGKKRFKL